MHEPLSKLGPHRPGHGSQVNVSMFTGYELLAFIQFGLVRERRSSATNFQGISQAFQKALA